MSKAEHTLKLQWAIAEQLRLLDAHDAFWIELVRQKAFTPDVCKELMTKYSLKQGRGHVFLRDNLPTLLPKLDSLFRPQFRGKSKSHLDEMSDRWKEGVELISDAFESENRVTGPKLISAVSKILWFYHPDKTTMYDRYAKKALNCPANAAGAKFANAFEQRFEAEKSRIEEALESSPRKYPYPLRILDKLLWLEGSGEEKTILERYRAGRDYAPM